MLFVAFLLTQRAFFCGSIPSDMDVTYVSGLRRIRGSERSSWSLSLSAQTQTEHERHAWRHYRADINTVRPS